MDQFTSALLRAMEEAESALGVKQVRLHQTAEKYGGVSAAKYYISHGRASDGFDALAKQKHLELSMEALVTAPLTTDFLPTRRSTPAFPFCAAPTTIRNKEL